MFHVTVRVGVLGAVGGMLIALFSLVPLIGLFLVFAFNGALWVILGALLARWRSPDAATEHLMGAAMLVGEMSALANGLMTVLLAPVGLLLLGGPYGALQLLPRAIAQFYQGMGIPPAAVFSPAGVLLGASLFCGTQVVIAPLVTALAGAVVDRMWGPTAWDLWEEGPTLYMLDDGRWITDRS